MSVKWLAMLILLAWAFATSAAVHRKVDVVLLLDTSASMLTSDPDSLRVKAVRGFMALLDAEDRLAVLSFGDHVKRISDFVRMDREARLRLESRVIPEMTPSGAYTNLYVPLDQALELLRSRRTDAEPMVVLFTDGRMDMGDAKIEQRLTHDLIEHVLPRFRNSGARIFGLAFSEGSDRGLLDSAALNTGGFSHSAKRAEDVWRAFGNLFEDIKKPDRLPVKDGRFVVDASVTGFRLLSSAGSTLPVSVRSPSGRNTVTPLTESGNPVLTVRSPEPGEWSIANASGDDKVVAESSIELFTDLPDYLAAGRLPRLVRAWLEEGSGSSESAPVPSRVSLQWWPEQDSGVRHSVPLQRSGSQQVFAGQLTALAVGTYHLQLDMEGSGFQRSKHLTLRVVSDSTTIPAVAQLTPSPRLSASPAPTPTPSASASPQAGSGTAFFGLFRIEDQMGWTALRIGIWSNLVLCVVIGAVLYWRRRHRTGKPQ